VNYTEPRTYKGGGCKQRGRSQTDCAEVPVLSTHFKQHRGIARPLVFFAQTAHTSPDLPRPIYTKAKTNAERRPGFINHRKAAFNLDSGPQWHLALSFLASACCSQKIMHRQSSPCFLSLHRFYSTFKGPIQAAIFFCSPFCFVRLPSAVSAFDDDNKTTAAFNLRCHGHPDHPSRPDHPGHPGHPDRPDVQTAQNATRNRPRGCLHDECRGL